MNHYIRIPPCHGHQTYLNLFHLNHKATPRCTMFHNKNVAAKAAIMEKGLCARAAHRFFFKVCMPLKENKHINKYIYIYVSNTKHVWYFILCIYWVVFTRHRDNLGREVGEMYLFSLQTDCNMCHGQFLQHIGTPCVCLAVSILGTMENKRAWVGWDEKFGSN